MIILTYSMGIYFRHRYRTLGTGKEFDSERAVEKIAVSKEEFESKNPMWRSFMDKVSDLHPVVVSAEEALTTRSVYAVIDIGGSRYPIRISDHPGRGNLPGFVAQAIRKKTAMADRHNLGVLQATGANPLFAKAFLPRRREKMKILQYEVSGLLSPVVDKLVDKLYKINEKISDAFELNGFPNIKEKDEIPTLSKIKKTAEVQKIKTLLDEKEELQHQLRRMPW